MLKFFLFLSLTRFSTLTEDNRPQNYSARSKLKSLITQVNLFPLLEKAEMVIVNAQLMTSLSTWERPIAAWYPLLSLTPRPGRI